MNEQGGEGERPRLLLVEDDPALGPALSLALSRRGYAVAQATSGTTAFERVTAEAFGLVVLDLTLPELDGMEVLRRLRALGHTVPVLVLTARSAVGDKVLGLKAGADDYLAKPFDLDELEARLQALIRRSRTGVGNQRVGGMRIDARAGTVSWNDRPLELTPREFAFLAAVLERPGHAVMRERLFDRVFGEGADAQLDAIEVVAYRLRKKLAETSIERVGLRGVGYLARERSSRG